MKKEEILQYNKSCAEFLGKDKTGIDVTWTFPTYLNGCLWVDEHFFNNTDEYYGRRITKVSELKFHLDWNWIMEVVSKINILPNPKNLSDTTLQTKRTDVQSLLRSANKELVVEAINQFLIWYEQNK